MVWRMRPGKGVTSCSGVTRDMVFDENDVTVMRFSGECDRLLQMGGRFMGTKDEFLRVPRLDGRPDAEWGGRFGP